MMPDTPRNTSDSAPNGNGFQYGTLAFAGGIVLLTALFAQFGVALGGMVLLTPAVGFFWARREYVPALSVAVFSALTALPNVTATGFLFAADAAGILMAIGLQRWTFGRCLVLATAVLFIPQAGFTLLHWDQQRHEVTIFINAQIANMEKSAGNPDRIENAVAFLKEMDLQWAHLNLGFSFGAILLMSAVQLGLLARWLRASGMPPPDAFLFRRLRPPEWLVWIAILLAACWFIDHRSPWEPLRFFTWNSALALAFVYWLNGFAILIYAMVAFRVHPLLFTASIFLLFLSGGHTLLATVGFFDTWWEVRPWCDRITGPPPLPPDASEDNT